MLTRNFEAQLERSKTLLADGGAAIATDGASRAVAAAEHAATGTAETATASLARAVALTGDTAKGRKAYEDFFALWKDADPELPILIEAKREYERLR